MKSLQTKHVKRSNQAHECLFLQTSHQLIIVQSGSESSRSESDLKISLCFITSTTFKEQSPEEVIYI